MFKPMFASLLAVTLSMPGCPKLDSPPPAVSARIGQPAPEIDGVDLDGVPMKLSEFRGKVVALSFWANWCGHCRDLFPHEKELVEKNKDRPFALLGVNADDSREEAKAVHDKNRLTWRSFHIGDPGGPVPRQWAIGGWPTIYLVDATGKIRYRFEGKQPGNVDRAVATLLREMDVVRKN